MSQERAGRFITAAAGHARRPRTRELVLIALMSALVVCVHLFFHVTIPIPAGTAMVILSGIALGPWAGFSIGALSRFLCNFYLLQGAWTPWQMFSWGLVGLLAGLAFAKPGPADCARKMTVSAEESGGGKKRRKKRNARGGFRKTDGVVWLLAGAAGPAAAAVSYLLLPQSGGGLFGMRTYAFTAAAVFAAAVLDRRKLPAAPALMAVAAFFLTFCVYGGIMNLAAALTSAGIPEGEAVTFGALRTVYLTGIPYDFAHALTTAGMVYLLGGRFTERLSWIRIRYGLFR